MEDDGENCTEAECVPVAMSEKDTTQVTYKDHITNEEILRRTCSRKLADTVTECRFRMAGHVLRLPSSRPARGAITWTPEGVARRRDDMAEDISTGLGKGWDHMAGS